MDNDPSAVVNERLQVQIKIIYEASKKIVQIVEHKRR